MSFEKTNTFTLCVQTYLLNTVTGNFQFTTWWIYVAPIMLKTFDVKPLSGT